MRDKKKGMLFGLIVGDALGVPGEFMSRKKLKENPIKGMEFGGCHDQPKGTWSDDTTMTLCLIQSYIEKGFLDTKDVMDKFVKWYSEGYMTPWGEVFDIGITTRQAILKYKLTGDIKTCGTTDPDALGNGSVMRIAPMLLIDQTADKIQDVCALTYNNYTSWILCKGYINFLRDLMVMSKEEAYKRKSIIKEQFKEVYYVKEKTEDEIRSSGYIIHTMQAAIWCFMNTDSFEECVLKAVNLGDDTDTIASIAGAIAGVYYGYDSIPQEWIKELAKVDELETMIEKFIDMTSEKEA